MFLDVKTEQTKDIMQQCPGLEEVGNDEVEDNARYFSGNNGAFSADALSVLVSVALASDPSIAAADCCYCATTASSTDRSEGGAVCASCTSTSSSSSISVSAASSSSLIAPAAAATTTLSASSIATSSTSATAYPNAPSASSHIKRGPAMLILWDSLVGVAADDDGE